MANQPPTRDRNLDSLATITLIVAISGVTMTFGALIAVFLLRGLHTEYWSEIKLPGILWLSTGILIASSVLFERARRHLMAGQQAIFNRMMGWTIGLGLAFLATQVTAGVEILQSGVVMTNNPHSWFVFLFGGLHGLHIVFGLVGLIVLYYRTRERRTGPRYQAGTRSGALAVGIFWHYMDGMWILLFALLMFWKR